jgi:hypothetical protein
MTFEALSNVPKRDAVGPANDLADLPLGDALSEQALRLASDPGAARLAVSFPAYRIVDPPDAGRATAHQRSVHSA